MSTVRACGKLFAFLLNPFGYFKLKFFSYRSQGEVTMQLQEIGQVKLVKLVKMVKLGKYSEI